ncbi:phosphotransferase [Planotetraspora thailandica]|uniref:phosphotransferase n=1 Tax=Planotetraspora thailandica TaxID=487172 RepID=UPI00195091B2|nr:phosphotransferase [Planotetraspora thailandica]
MIKRFRSRSRDEPYCEWRALTLLSRHAPGLAPEPLQAELYGDQPTVVMSRLGGSQLRGTRVPQDQITALANALTTLHTAVPPSVLTTLPLRRGHAVELVELVGAWAPEPAPPVVRHAMSEGRRWLEKEAGGFRAPLGQPVFGRGDSNLANFLWDGSRVRMVDFEDSGRSDRAFELAEVTEHVSTWVDSDFDHRAFLDHFDLGPSERGRLGAARRLLALTWLRVLAGDDADNPRNPPGTLERQAERVLELLAA